jgi:hypothetical protein
MGGDMRSIGHRAGILAGVAAGAAVGWAGEASAAVVTLQAGKDNTLIQNATGALSNGAGSGLFVGRTGQATDSIRRALVAFDLSSIPAGAAVTAVSLAMNVSQTTSPDVSVELRRVQRNWGEGTSVGASGGGGGAASTPGDATWVHSVYNTQFWTTPGGDFSSTPSAATTVGFGPRTWTGTGLVADVQAWLASPATNFGWAMVGTESDPVAHRFDSRESATVAARPALTVTYDVAVPEPAALGLLAPLVLLRRRRYRPITD